MGANNLPRVAARQCTGRESNPWSLDHKSNALPLHYQLPTKWWEAIKPDLLEKYWQNIATTGENAENYTVHRKKTVQFRLRL